ncbi:MAG: GTP 3',8-cyclase MoaA [Pseudobdellovibrio sp.]
MRALRDSQDRHFTYLRLSLTEVCNFRCTYCLPDGYKSTCSDSFLDENEIINLLQAFAELGISKVRLTGGEPTLRQDITSIVQKISKIAGIKKIGLTTNGYRLQQLAEPLFAAGLTNLNVSVDSLDPENFYKITGKPLLKNILSGIENAITCGIPTVKMNSVYLKDLNDAELPNFMEFVRHNPISVRFIELMQTGNNNDYFKQHHLSTLTIDSYLEENGWKKVVKQISDGPALEFSHPEYLGRIGRIAPYAKDFCNSCNRLRVSSRGGLQLCLFGAGQVNLRNLLQSSNQKNELKQIICDSLFTKLARHNLQAGDTGLTKNLALIGG